MYIITSKLNSTFGTICKATGIKMTAKAVGKNSSFRISDYAAKHICKILNNFSLLNRFLRLSLNENLLLLNFLSHVFQFWSL